MTTLAKSTSLKLSGFRFYWLFFIFEVLFSFQAKTQEYSQFLKGVIFDSETHIPVPGVFVNCTTCTPSVKCISDSLGQFKILVPTGRHSLLLSHIGYTNKEVKDILVGTGKEIFLSIGMEERIYRAGEVTVKGTTTRWMNPMASVSARTLRSQDAAMYAGGYFDPSRMVANFPGVASGISDESNEIVIRGNSPRGLLWRLEGLEIPNPNHFSSGEGASGGGYSSVSTNVLSGFDFFTSAFPAEFGNASSGVMDLNLRNGNSGKREYSLALSILGAEGSAEGPLNSKKEGSYLANFRYGDFGLLTKYGIIDDEDLGIAPQTLDWAMKYSLKTKKAGTFDFFTVGAKSKAGDKASAAEVRNGTDTDEYIDRHFMAVVGFKHTLNFRNNKTYLRTTAGFTKEMNSGLDNKVDTLLRRTETYYDQFKYPAFRVATLMNIKLNARNSLRLGANLNLVWADLFARRLSNTKYDTLINSGAKGWYSGYFIQWKNKTGSAIETNTGLHLFYSAITREFIAEPRFGIIFNLPRNQSVNFGSGMHSRLEPLSIYHYNVKISTTTREEKNIDLKTSRALHLVLGYNKRFGQDILFTAESYIQFLYNVPISENIKNQFSVLNLIHGLPDVVLVNKGRGTNKGIEMTLEKVFSHNYFFLLTASIFDSKYKAPDGNWYNTYFNTNYVYNLSGGKEFPLGKYKNSIVGFKMRGMFRGGFRYTPVDMEQSLTKKKLVYSTEIYGDRLPGFKRIDFGASYRLNRENVSWSVLVDIQNILDTKNILQRRFSYQNKNVVMYDSKTFGLIPIFTVRADF